MTSPAAARAADHQRISVFPLAGALLFPRALLPLHIFEPRYRAMIADALARDRRIGMIQPRGGGTRPPLFQVGCLGRIAEVEALDDGRYNLVLEGLTRFRVVRELDAGTPFRQVEASVAEWADATTPAPLAPIQRAELERESRRFAEARGYLVDWDAVGQVDDEALVNGIAQLAPFDAAAKQGLLEAENLSERADLIVQLLAFFARREGDEDGATLQ